MNGEEEMDSKSRLATDAVNHPSHYADSCSMECIDVMEMVFGSEMVSWYCLVNAFKYMWRWKHKNGIEDLDKASWYLDRYNSSGNVPLKKMQDVYAKLVSMMEEFRKANLND